MQPLFKFYNLKRKFGKFLRVDIFGTVGSEVAMKREMAQVRNL